uniref:Uncharacterized protein n=1 Tax=Romanomermis culicivorax TaxID=13658 RepID=A0A915HSK5_ROMCU
MTTGAQTLAAIAQQHPVAATKPGPTVANIFGETLRPVNDEVSIIEALPFLSPKIGILWQVYPCEGLVIDFPSKEPISSDDDGKE